MSWIEEHYSEHFHLETLAKELHLSTYHLCHLFRKATGSSIRDELTARRVKAAALLLATTELPVCAIAEQVGMPNGAHFSTVFRKRLGVSPSQYRRRMRNA